MQIKIIKKANFKTKEGLLKKATRASLMDLGHVMEYPVNKLKKQKQKIAK